MKKTMSHISKDGPEEKNKNFKIIYLIRHISIETGSLETWLFIWKHLVWNMIAIMRNATPWPFNTLKPKQNDHHFADDIFSFIYLYKNLLHYDSSFTDVCQSIKQQ